MSVQAENRGRWVFKVMHDLEKIQKARFEGTSLGKSQSLKLAWGLYKAKASAQKLNALMSIISTTGDTPTQVKQKVELYIRTLESEEAQAYVRQITIEESKIGTITEDFGLVSIPITEYFGGEAPTAEVSALSQWYDDMKDAGAILSPSEFFREMSRYLISTSIFVMANTLQYTIPQLITEGLGADPDYLMIKKQSTPCVLWGLPLRHVKSIEVARSGKILKFRATGSVFLANQEGGEDAVRIEGTIYRREIIIFLLLWLMFLYGQGDTKEVQGIADLLKNPTSLINIRSKIHTILPYNQRTTKPSYEFHKTFPLVTKHVIIPNCYIETLSMEEKVVNGRDAYTYAILLRTYRKPTGFDIWTASPTKSYLVSKANKNLNTYKTIEAALNQMWRYAQANDIIFEEKQWRISSAIENPIAEDRYYDLDAQDIAIVTTLGVAGFIN